ncbi:MAG: M23 family metallopeptidase [Gemmatimonadales bacterium]
MRRRAPLILTVISIGLTSQLGAQDQAAKPIGAVVIHPFIAPRFACTEHYEGELPYAFDALGTDCFVTVEGRSYRTDGRSNSDYYIFGEPVLAPFDGVVEKVVINPVVNQPGTLGEPPATLIIFRRADGVRVMYGHLDSVAVAEGDAVEAGQGVAVVSNNGISRGPHVHVGAVDASGDPVQIRWDLRAMARLRAKR